VVTTIFTNHLLSLPSSSSTRICASHYQYCADCAAGRYRFEKCPPPPRSHTAEPNESMMSWTTPFSLPTMEDLNFPVAAPRSDDRRDQCILPPTATTAALLLAASSQMSAGVPPSSLQVQQQYNYHQQQQQQHDDVAVQRPLYRDYSQEQPRDGYDDDYVQAARTTGNSTPFPVKLYDVRLPVYFLLYLANISLVVLTPTFRPIRFSFADARTRIRPVSHCRMAAARKVS